jgi:chaperonin cofactor prefoldin
VFHDFVPIIVAGLLSGGFIGGVVAFMKLRPEVQQILVSTAQDAVVIQSGVIDDLNDQLERARKRITAAESDNERLRARVSSLEKELGVLRKQVENGHG